MTREIKNPGRGYSGKEKIKIYHYDKSGNYIKTFESLSELRKEYFPHDIGKRPLCRGIKWNKFKYDTLEDGTHYSNHRIGRDHIRKFEKAYNSNLCMKNDYNRPVIMYNLLHEPVAVFNNEYIAAETVKIPVNRVQYDCKNSKQQPQKDFYFKYKN